MGAGHRGQPVWSGARCRAVIPALCRRGYGKIVNLSGGGATKPLAGMSAYAASKAAVVRLTETLADDLRGDGVDVNAIAPGALNTRMLDEVLAAGPEKVGEAYYEGALKQRDSGGASLEKAAALVVFLASAASDGITRPPDQRRLGRLVQAARAARAGGEGRCLHAPPDRAGGSEPVMVMRVVDRGLRPDRQQAGPVAGRLKPVVAAVDIDPARCGRRRRGSAGARPRATGARPSSDLTSTLVFVATTNDIACPGHGGRGASAASTSRREARGSQRARSSNRSLGAAQRAGVVVKVGFNHRFHPAFRKARELFDSGALGR